MTATHKHMLSSSLWSISHKNACTSLAGVL